MAGDTAETLEVAIQCLEQVFKVESYDEIHKQSLKVDKPLQEIFDAYTKEHFPDMPETTGGTTVMQPTANARERAEQLKAEGNQLMKIEKYPEAINCYTQAIALDNTNPVYPCNRAAAYSKLAEHQKAVDDCKRALKLDPKYSKAYGRMGLSYQNMNDLPKAQESYQKAIELEPENVFYKNNLRVIEEGLSQASSGPARGVPPGVGAGAGMPNLGGVDFASLFSNPAVMNMAQTFMQSPQMQQMVSGMMTGGAMGGGGATGGGGGGGGAAPGGGMGQLFQAFHPNKTLNERILGLYDKDKDSCICVTRETMYG
ncbi:hypothetical protein QZH41_006361 [Actinostola sp. cb2023]|nr:hypothetical protein QZH41_006361 [Actinostola sp. cb2023]